MKTILKLWSLLTLITISQLSMAGSFRPVAESIWTQHKKQVREFVTKTTETLDSDPDVLVGGFKGVVTQATPITPHVTTSVRATKSDITTITDHVAQTADVSSQAIKGMADCVEDVAYVSKQAINTMATTTKQVATTTKQVADNLEANSVGQVVDQTIQTSQDWWSYAQEKLLAGLNSQAGIGITSTIGTCAAAANCFHRVAQYGRENQDDTLRNKSCRYTEYAKNLFLAGMSGLSAYVLQNQALLEKYPYLCAIPVAITAADIVLQSNKFYPYREHPKNTMKEMGKTRNNAGLFNTYCVHCNGVCGPNNTGQNTLNNSTGTIGNSTVSCPSCQNNRSNLIAERVIRGTAAAALAGVAYRLTSK